MLSVGERFSFNGSLKEKLGRIYSLTKDETYSKMKCMEENISKDEFVTQQARGTYIAAMCRPDLTTAFENASQVVDLPI